MTHNTFFKKRCSAVCEMLKTLEALNLSNKKVFFEDAYFVLDFVVAEDYNNVYYENDGLSVLEDCMFHDLPKHTKKELYYKDFANLCIPTYTDEQLKERYFIRTMYNPSPTRKDLLEAAAINFKCVVEYLAKLFEVVDGISNSLIFK